MASACVFPRWRKKVLVSWPSQPQVLCLQPQVLFVTRSSNHKIDHDLRKAQVALSNNENKRCQMFLSTSQVMEEFNMRNGRSKAENAVLTAGVPESEGTSGPFLSSSHSILTEPFISNGSLP